MLSILFIYIMLINSLYSSLVGTWYFWFYRRWSQTIEWSNEVTCQKLHSQDLNSCTLIPEHKLLTRILYVKSKFHECQRSRKNGSGKTKETDPAGVLEVY